MTKRTQGLFISIDGPNGAGKSTFIRELSKCFSLRSALFFTREPSDTPFGHYVKCNEGRLSGLPYAYLICADRCHQVENEIVPHLNAGETVISDRYIESSLVCQNFDGVPIDKIWDLNKDFPVPQLSIMLLADESVLRYRLSQRDKLSDFELRMTRVEELQRYIAAKEFLMQKGLRYVVCYNNTLKDLERNIADIAKEIERLL